MRHTYIQPTMKVVLLTGNIFFCQGSKGPINTERWVDEDPVLEGEAPSREFDWDDEEDYDDEY